MKKPTKDTEESMKFEDVDYITVYKENGDLIARFFEDEEGIKTVCKDGYLTDIAEKEKSEI